MYDALCQYHVYEAPSKQQLNNILKQLTQDGFRVRQIFQEATAGQYCYVTFAEMTAEKIYQEKQKRHQVVEVKESQIVAELQAGHGIRELGRKYGMNPGRVWSIKKQAEAAGTVFPGRISDRTLKVGGAL
jgi:hypothetical protein